MGDDSTEMRAGFGGWERRNVRTLGKRSRGHPHPVFSVSVASKGLSHTISLLFATLAGIFISVAAKGLKARVGSDQWTVVSEGKNKKTELERDERGWMRCDSSR
jgi:hypothetical protein